MALLSFRRRLLLAHLASIVVVLGIAASGGYWGLSRAVHGQLDAALLALAETESSMLASSAGQPVRVHEASPGPAPPSFQRLDRLVQVVDAKGNVLARSANLGESKLPTPPALIERLGSGEPVFETLQGFGEEPVRMVSVLQRTGGALHIVQVAGSLDDVNNVVESAGVLFLALGVALVVAVGTAGVLLTRQAFGAINNVVQQARRIGEASLDRRLPHPGTRDEVGRLVDTLNEMLGRLEHAFEAQRRFTADASHELRSPLSRLRTELEVALRRPREAAEYVAALRSCLDDVQRLTQLVEELLALARLDAGQERPPTEAVPMNRLALDVVNRLQSAALKRQVTLAIEPSSDVEVAINPRSADLVLANLLDNAVKFSPAGGRVTVRFELTEAEVAVRVVDNGPGLSVTEVPYLFDRFFRGSAARASEVPGVGLGLALSDAMVRAHGGRIEAANGPRGGAVFTVWFPRVVPGEFNLAAAGR